VPGALTDPDSVRASALRYRGADGEPIGAYLAEPAAPGRRPGMIVIHEAGGLGEHIRDVSNRFAALGYTVLAPDLFTREGGPPDRDNLTELIGRLAAMPDERVLGDLSAAAALLRSRADATGAVGCIGFCMGGRYTLLFACARSELQAAIDCWGGFIDAATPTERASRQRPTPPLELAPALSCPLMAAFGAQDTNPSPAVAAQLQSALATCPHEVQIDIYEGAGHAFFADYRPSYRPQAAAALWERVVPFLRSHLPLEA
jgi:carboxymethylenebutenolidase